MAQENSSYPTPPLPTRLSSQWDSRQDQWHTPPATQDHSRVRNTSLSPRRRPVPARRHGHSSSIGSQMPTSPAVKAPRHSPALQTSRSSVPQLPVFAGFDSNEPLYSFGDLHISDASQHKESADSLALRNRHSGVLEASQDHEPVHWGSAATSMLPAEDGAQDVVQSERLQYHAFDDDYKRHSYRVSQMALATHSRQSSSSGGDRHLSQLLDVPKSASNSRPTSSYSDYRGRTFTPYSSHHSDHSSPHGYDRDRPVSRRSPGSRPISYVSELNNVPYSQQVAPGGSLVHKDLQSIVGSGASLLNTREKIDMYRSNIKKDTEPPVQYEFAILMVNTARDAASDSDLDSVALIAEAKHILQRLADRAYPFAQYYLGDGYFSGLFNKEKPDHEKALSQFVAASKHGHAEAGYRAALCYEFGWGSNKNHSKAYQFYRASASKNHPGAATRLGLACLNGEMGLGRDKYREGVKWLKRAQEGADFQYNSAPFELGRLHLTGYGDDIFRDDAYAAQLFTQSAELGHAQANYLLGQAYETGLYNCPRDAALSVHFYNGAATKGHADAMMALCAWYMVGAEPVLEKDESEAYAWALQAAETGYAKAEYAVAYFTEMGIGCRRDPLEANVWYVRAAEQGDEKARQRLQLIRAAAAGSSGASPTDVNTKGKKKFMGLF